MYTSLCCGCFDFYPRSPCGERPACQGPPLRGICISIHALLAESDAPQQENGQAATISIHALLAESDSLSSSSWGFMLISIHALLAESDVNSDYYGRLCYEISIHALLAESDWQKYDLNKDCLDFYPRSPCGERLKPKIRLSLSIMISIHALLAESDINKRCKLDRDNRFLSTLSLRRATLSFYAQNRHLAFLSTLSLRRATSWFARLA